MAIAEIRKNAGTQFAPEVVEKFVQATASGFVPVTAGQGALLHLFDAARA
jgi:HD-GYP domain-containing protein (c-di-GMP phosphodiesterase class II)